MIMTAGLEKNKNKNYTVEPVSCGIFQARVRRMLDRDTNTTTGQHEELGLAARAAVWV